MCNIDPSYLEVWDRGETILLGMSFLSVSWFLPLVYYVTNGVILVEICPYAGLNVCLRAQSFRASKRTSYQTSEIYLDIIQPRTRALQPLITASFNVHTDENATCL